MTTPRLRCLSPGFLASLLVPFFALASPGDLDLAFGSGGRVTTAFTAPAVPGYVTSGYASASAAAIQPDGKVLVVGQVSQASQGTGLEIVYVALARYLPDGGLDASFGNQGRALVEIPGEWPVPASVSLQADGRIVVAGRSFTAGASAGTFSAYRLFVMRLDSNGALDPTFAGTGYDLRQIQSSTYSGYAAVQTDGKIVVAAATGGITMPSILGLVRYLPEGAMDGTFGAGGTVTVQLPIMSDPQVAGLALQPDGRIVVAPRYTVPNASQLTIRQFTAFRFDENGNPDPTFNGIGQVTTNPTAASAAYALALAPNGRILVAGSSASPGAPAYSGSVSRINPNGTVDLSFGTNGSQTFASGSQAVGVAQQADGRVLTLAQSLLMPRDLVVARTGVYGGIDPGFGSGGTVTLDFGSAFDAPVALLVQPDGKAITVSHREGLFALARIELEGTAIVVSASANPSQAGSPLTLIASVYGRSPSGTVTFREAATALPGCSDLVLASGVAACDAAALTPGAHAITASYSGDGDDPAATSRTMTQFVLTSGGDADGDGVPDDVETLEALDPVVKDNDLFPATAKGNRLFTMQQYRDFLAREGDPGGIAYWSAQLAGGAVNRLQFVEAFFRSAEFQGIIAPVTRLYFACFLRVPDYAGLDFWIRQARAGNALETIAGYFAGSVEFLARYGSLDNAQYIDLLYQNILGRSADAAGRAYWTMQIETGALTRGQVLANFSESPEYRTAINSEVYVTMMYAAMLRRAPDAGGFAYWVGFMDAGNSGLALIDGFLGSVEYRSRFLP